MAVHTYLSLALALLYATYMIETNEMYTWKDFFMLILFAIRNVTFGTVIYYFFNIHKLFGFFKIQEPWFHFVFVFKTMWVVVLWGIGQACLQMTLGVSRTWPKIGFPYALWEISPEYQILPELTNTSQKLLAAVFIFYTTDFCRYWAHRMGHMGFLYKTFPFAHFQHHNQMFMNPSLTLVSPLIHIAAWATYIPLTFYWVQGWQIPVLWAVYPIHFVTATQHLGFDPFPWLTWMNYKYFFGALPWIPLYHQYHHTPFIRPGNYGNTTCLFDHVFGTLQTEFVEHVETGKMPSKLWAKIHDDPAKFESILEAKLRNKNKLDLNAEGRSILNFEYE